MTINLPKSASCYPGPRLPNRIGKKARHVQSHTLCAAQKVDARRMWLWWWLWFWGRLRSWLWLLLLLHYPFCCRCRLFSSLAPIDCVTRSLLKESHSHKSWFNCTLPIVRSLWRHQIYRGIQPLSSLASAAVPGCTMLYPPPNSAARMLKGVTRSLSPMMCSVGSGNFETSPAWHRCRSPLSCNSRWKKQPTVPV